MRQALRINHNMTLNSRDFLARIVTFAASRIRILYTLSINDAKTRFLAATMAGADLANPIFLKPAQAGSALHQNLWHSTGRNNDKRYSTSENHSVAFAIGTRFSIRTEPHKKPRTGQPALAWSFSVHFRAEAE